MQECYNNGASISIKCIENEKEYIRTIEGMGEGLVLFETSVVNKRIGQNFHLFFEDKRKPPLDIAINPDSKTIEYFSYFAQDEKIIERVILNTIEYKSGVIMIENELFGENNTNIDLDKKFEIVKSHNDIFMLSTDITNEPLQAYRVDDSNFLLFYNNCEFSGILLKNISAKELREIADSQCF